MTALLLLLAVELPLGPFARPGVPVLATSDDPVAIDLAGWPWRVRGPTEIAPPQLPCTIALPGGSLELRPAPAGTPLVGALHAEFAGAVPIRLVRGMGWQPLDVFDRIVAGPCEPWERAILDAWARAGGDVRPAEGDAPPAEPPAIPRAGSVLPEIYDLATAGGTGSRSVEGARVLVAAMAGALALLLLAAAFRRLAARPAALLCLLVAAVGGAVGAWRTHRDAEPFSRASVVIHYPGRTRTFTLLRAEWDGAAAPAPPGTPFFYRGPGDPWWADGDRVLRADEGIIRGFVRDGPPEAPRREGDSEPRLVLRRIFRSQVPQGAEPRWWWGLPAFAGGAAPVRPILEVEVGGVR